MSYIGNQPSSIAFLTDTFNGNGSTTAFTLSAAPAGTSSILVAISGVVQDPSTYSVVGTTLTFSPAPPTGTGNISVRFLGIPASGVTTTAYRTVTEFTATAAQTTFSTPSYTPGFIDVYRNGVMLGSADYTATNGVSVVLASGATAGDLVEVISFSVSSVLNAIPATAGSVNTSNLVDGSVTTAKIADGAVTTAKIAAGAVITADLADGAVTSTKLASGAINSQALSLFNASGSAPVYACRAWAKFVGTGTPTINASGNVSSITDAGVGQYGVNFTTAMPDANYSAIADTSAQLYDQGTGIGTDNTNASSVRVECLNGSTYFDANFVYVAVFR